MRNFIFGLKNIIKWIPIIYNDRDWDSYYIYKLLYFKFSNMEKEFDGTWFVGENKVRHKIKVCKNLCKRLIDDNYIEYTDDFRFVLFKGNIIPYSMRVALYEKYMRKQDINYLFNYLTKYMEEFWK